VARRRWTLRSNGKIDEFIAFYIALQQDNTIDKSIDKDYSLNQRKSTFSTRERREQTA
jgi:hypothetical protein